MGGDRGVKLRSVCGELIQQDYDRLCRKGSKLQNIVIGKMAYLELIYVRKCPRCKLLGGFEDG